jgi:glycosyltransferase involved in cell wall biosynthesis
VTAKAFVRAPPSSSPNRKVFLLDPVCVQEKGHNLTALTRYARLLDAKGHQTTCFVSRHLGTVSSKISLKRIFNHYYPNELKIDTSPNIKLPSNKGQPLDLYLRGLAKDDLRALLKTVKPGPGDIIFYPSIDYYSARAVVDLLSDEPELLNRNSWLIIRWIAVMENNSVVGSSELLTVLSKLRELGKRLNIKHTAESSIYAKFLANRLDADVSVTLTVCDEVEDIEISTPDYPTIIFPGSARRDKGFDRIANILHKIEEINPELEYRAICQLPSADELGLYLAAAAELGRNPRVLFFPDTVSSETIAAIYRVADVVVLPYDPVVYQMRSSAVMSEALAFKKNIVASRNCGFSRELQSLADGYLAMTDHDFAGKICEILSQPLSSRSQLAELASKRYFTEINASYEKLFRCEH